MTFLNDRTDYIRSILFTSTKMALSITFQITGILLLVTNTFALENLSLNKSAEMSSQRYANSGADGAVDGNTVDTADSGSCALTDLNYSPEAWWRVDLNGTYAITELKIYLLNTDLFRFRLYSVYVSDDLVDWKTTYCMRNSDLFGAQFSPMTLECNAKGRYVTILSDRGSDCMSAGIVNFCAILQLCEVQILGCYPGNYGRSCNLTCPDNCRDDLCSIDEGDCYGCSAGYLGNQCDNECPAGHFGQDCLERCPDEFCKGNDSCSHVNGFCPNRCINGYIGSFCNISCSRGYYGQYCRRICGNCLDNDTCLYTNGSCVRGCANGWLGFDCSTKCPAGTYGKDCSETCTGLCANNDTCSHINGSCPNGCIDGYTGSFCNASCDYGKYGKSCGLACSGNCLLNATCHKENGSCQNGCKVGWRGTLCNTPCSDGHFGLNCQEMCSGHCKELATCDVYTGTCAEGCTSGWEGLSCNESCRRGRYGENCSYICPMCEYGCHIVSGTCLSMGMPVVTQVSITPWVITGVACTITLLTILFNVIMYRRGQGHICPKAKRPGAAASSTDGSGAERSNTTGNYEELQTAASQSNVYDSLSDGNIQYENTFRA